jgi:hypothetical protein
MFEFMKSDQFTFLVHGRSFESELAEAVLISPAVSDALRTNPLNRSFLISSESIQSEDFNAFLTFVRCRDRVCIPRSRAVSFISISNYLGNESLVVALFSLLKPGPGTELHIGNCEGAIDECASQFYSYSADDLRFIERGTLHRLLSSDSLLIESEDSLLRLLLTLGADRGDFFSYIEVPFLSAEGLSLFLSQLNFNDLSEALWLKILPRLQGISPSRRGLRRYRKSLDSLILRQIPSGLSDVIGGSWALVYRGSRDGFGASDFHNKCNGCANTVTLIRSTKGYVFGGFTPIAWDSSNSDKADSSELSFLFTIKNPRGEEFRRFSVINSSRAIGCWASSGPIFGDTYDIHVYNGCNATTSNFTSLGRAYANDTGMNGQQIFTGEFNFAVEEIEVFVINE